MREIKFRAWADYGNSGEMFPNIQNHINGEWAFGNILMNKVECVTFKVMQYTGIKDKNGVEIYEGDIIELYDDVYLVSFNDKNYGGVMGWNNLDPSGHAEEFYYGVSPSSSYRVVGNIYENPELLE